MAQLRHRDEDIKLWYNFDGKGIDAGFINNKKILKILLKLVFLVSNGNLPTNLTEEQSKQWIKDNIKG